MPLHLRAPAKINLGLEVLRRREDGFHDINTVFAAIGVYDDFELESTGTGEITCTVSGAGGIPEQDNLCIKAASILRKALGRPDLGLAITLRKNIPMGAGLGGGSSDAAAVLMGASQLWNAPASIDLAALGAMLGSDVPFFLGSSLALALGRGEVLKPLDLHLPWHLLLVNPGIHVSTPWAYQAIERTGERSQTDLEAAIIQGISQPDCIRETVVNDFETPVFAAYPRLAAIKEQLYAAGAVYASMSGSGSTMYGLFESEAAAVTAAGRFAGWVRVAEFVG